MIGILENFKLFVDLGVLFLHFHPLLDKNQVGKNNLSPSFLLIFSFPSSKTNSTIKNVIPSFPFPPVPPRQTTNSALDKLVWY